MTEALEVRHPLCQHTQVYPDGTCVACGVLATVLPGLSEAHQMIAWPLVQQPAAGKCEWCAGTGKVTIPCPADHHNHDVTIACGRCGGAGQGE